ncbi:hypothetical protein RN001_005547 [Aquatica leii]|uniref:YqaJ viral recombinase domain-containing protein n=1 Tax=Aquatica leii TaxID=1421715 RepID=A0AAN7QKE4_9COLE|nr:hypothetical protein RN001_005547 [Aquatica leii]
MTKVNLSDILHYVGIALRPLREGEERITASRAYELYTYLKNKNPNWELKIQKYKNIDFKGNASTNYGLEQEEYALNAYTTEMEEIVYRCGLIIHPYIPWFGCSPDGLIINNGNSTKIIEIKCPVAGQYYTAEDLMHNGHLSYLKMIDNKTNINENHKYYCQIQMSST